STRGLFSPLAAGYAYLALAAATGQAAPPAGGPAAEPAGSGRAVLLPPIAAPTDPTCLQPSDLPPAGVRELAAEVLVQQVLARNPTLAQVAAAWQAAQARYPQVTSLEDPMFAATIGPETIRPDDPGLEFASRFEISQKYPWPGKLRLRGEN